MKAFIKSRQPHHERREHIRRSGLTAAEKAEELTALAIAQDHSQNYEQAITLYTDAAEYFLYAIKYDTESEDAQEKLRRKYMTHLDRAEELQICVKNINAYEKRRNEKAVEVPTSSDLYVNCMQTQPQIKIEDPSCSMPDSLLQEIEVKAYGIVTQKAANVRWADVAGLYEIKGKLQEMIIFPLKFPQLFDGVPKLLPRVLLYGPNGVGKSLVTKVLANESGSKLFSVYLPKLIHNWDGDSCQLMQNIFDLAVNQKPAIVHFDEIELMCCIGAHSSSDSSVKTAFLAELERLSSTKVVIIGETSAPWAIDTELLQKFEKRVYIPLPDEKTRGEILKHYLDEKAHELSGKDLDLVSKKSEGYSSSDLKQVVSTVQAQLSREVEEATHFRKFHVAHKSSDLFIPCAPDHIDAIPMRWNEIPEEKLREPPLMVNDIIFTLDAHKPAPVADDWNEKMDKFLRDYGH